MKIIFDDEGAELSLPLLPVMEEAGAFLLAEEGADSARAEVSLTIVSPAEIKDFRRRASWCWAMW